MFSTNFVCALMSSSLADDFPLVLDVEDACGTDRSGTQSPYNSDGPRNLEDVLDGPRAAAIHAVQHVRNDLNYLDRIRSFVECNMIVTSSLPGTGDLSDNVLQQDRMSRQP